jgi:hypothetical protein
MSQHWIASMEQPRGPVFSSKVRANYQLAWRMARIEGVRRNDLLGQVSSGLAVEIANTGQPSERRIREWVHDYPGFPERMLGIGAISKGDILSGFHHYLQSWVSNASMGQEQPRKVHREVGSESGISGLITTLLLAGAALALMAQVRRPRTGPRPLPHHSGTYQTMKRLRPAAGSIRSYRGNPSGSWPL